MILPFMSQFILTTKNCCNRRVREGKNICTNYDCTFIF